MEISNLVEKMDLIFARKQRGANTVHRRVAPTLLKERRYSRSIESLGPAASPHNRIRPSRPKTLQTSCRPHPSRSRDHRSQSYSRLTHGVSQSREISGKRGDALTVATIVSLATVIGDKRHGVIWGYQPRICRGKF